MRKMVVDMGDAMSGALVLIGDKLGPLPIVRPGRTDDAAEARRAPRQRRKLDAGEPQRPKAQAERSKPHEVQCL